MRRTPTLLLLAFLSACDQENTFIEVPPPELGAPGQIDSDVIPPPPEQPRFYLLDPTYAPAVSDDGTVLLWEWETGGDVYLWTEAEGLEWVTTTGATFNTVDDISADGRVIIGSYGNYMIEGEVTQAAIWTRDDGWTKLGALPDTLDCPMQSAGWSLTADGTVAVGLAFEGCSAFAFRWDEDHGMTPYEQVGNGGNRASRVSRDGALTVGFAQGDSNRTPAVWHADGTGEVLDMSWTGEFFGVNAQGTKAVGQFGSKAALWTKGEGHRFLGTLGAPGQSSSTAIALCGAEDELVIGTDTFAGGVATAWTEQTGLVQLQDYLESFGMAFPSGTRLSNALACTPDKTVFVGSGAIGDDVGSWVAVLPDHYLD